MKPHVLWIEDSARLELRNLCGPIYVRGQYDFDLAEDVTTAVDLLCNEVFDVVIVDIRLPPGTDGLWRKLYQRAGADKVQAQLGLRLLYWLLGMDSAHSLPAPPSWIGPQRIGIFTVESKLEFQKDLSKLGIKIFQEKIAGLPDTILCDLIDRVLSQNAVTA